MLMLTYNCFAPTMKEALPTTILYDFDCQQCWPLISSNLSPPIYKPHSLTLAPTLTVHTHSLTQTHSHTHTYFHSLSARLTLRHRESQQNQEWRYQAIQDQTQISDKFCLLKLKDPLSDSKVTLFFKVLPLNGDLLQKSTNFQ